MVGSDPGAPGNQIIRKLSHTDSTSRLKNQIAGGGMFTRGSKNPMVFDAARSVEVRRFTPTEEAQLDESPELLSVLAIEAYQRFGIPEGVGLLES